MALNKINVEAISFKTTTQDSLLASAKLSKKASEIDVRSNIYFSRPRETFYSTHKTLSKLVACFYLPAFKFSLKCLSFQKIAIILFTTIG